MKFVPISEARRELPTLVDSPDTHTISRQGRPVAVLMSYDAYEAMRADLELLRDPEALVQIERDYRRFMSDDGEPLPEYDPETGRFRREREGDAGGGRKTRVREVGEAFGPGTPEASPSLETLWAAFEDYRKLLARLESAISEVRESASTELPSE